jgi:pimeloyl-ACP methyl ester carboxylesterase
MNMPALTTASVPHQFLASAYLVGHIPQTALQSDKRVSYTLYIPPQHYHAKGEVQLPLLVFIHGTRRDLSPLHSDLEVFANANACAVLAPLFPAGLEGPHDVDSYKVLRSATLRSDLALLDILDVVGERWPGIQTDQVALIGFSGGGQFAHRFMYLHPERLLAVSVGAPGAVTLLDAKQRWPKGVADVEDVFGVSVDVGKIGEIAVQLIIGSEDVLSHGGAEFWRWLREMEDCLPPGAAKGDESRARSERSGRREHLRDLQTSLRGSGIDAELEVVDGVAHDSAGVRIKVLSFARLHLLRLAR